MHFKIRFQPEGKSIEIDTGTNLLDAAKHAGVHINSPCGGEGICGKCRVIVKDGEFESEKTGHLTQDEIDKGYLLACRTRIKGEMTVDVPIESRIRAGQKIATGVRGKDFKEIVRHEGFVEPITKKVYVELPLPTLEDHTSDFERLKRELENLDYDTKGILCDLSVIKRLPTALREGNWKATVTLLEDGEAIEIVDVQPGDLTKKRYGIAVDIGTTSVVVYLVDLVDGRIIDVASNYNPQMKYGDDVITRIVYATSKDSGLKDLNSLIISNINTLTEGIAKKNKIDLNLIDNIVIAGNTTMTHLFYGVNPQYIREEPYVPAANHFPLIKAKDLGIKANEQAIVYSLPGIASYVGGDITSGVLASGMCRTKELILFIDIGTNGEVVLGNCEWFITTACSAGPCFEGGGVKFGMRAMEGAIEQVTIDRDTYEASYKVIGNAKPTGICGSGMIDAIAEMYLSAVVDQRGKIQLDIETKRVRVGENGPEYVLVWKDEAGLDQDIALTEPDIDNIIRAKGAIYAGLAILLKEVGYTFNDVSKILIAGGFGNYIDVERAITIGLLPDLPIDKFKFLGNTSVMGAYLSLISGHLRREAEGIAKRMTYLELSVSRSFMDEYVSALFLPHTNVDAFPSVREMMEKRHSANAKVQ
ncbi:MAG: ASKHA domain-containing protein [Nitrospirota bacterium]